MNLLRFGKIALCAAVMSAPTFTMCAQEAAPAEMLNRTILIRGPQEQGTAFTIEHNGTLYLVTARHVVTGVPLEKATIQVRQKGEWKPLQTVKTLYPESPEVDIAVFETTFKMDQQKPFTVKLTGGEGGVQMGQPIWFLGYPFVEGMGSKTLDGQEAPFIKRGTMSAVVSSDPKAVVFYIDGFNNPGFSGGPIVYWDYAKHAYFILGVVKGYRQEQAVKAVVNGQTVDTQLLSNSGILVAYSIEHAIQAIEKAETSKAKH